MPWSGVHGKQGAEFGQLIFEGWILLDQLFGSLRNGAMGSFRNSPFGLFLSCFDLIHFFYSFLESFQHFC